MFREFAGGLERAQADRDAELHRALIAEAMHRAKDPHRVFVKLRSKAPDAPLQTPRQMDTAIDVLAAQYGWKPRPVAAARAS